jgi:hypothetical protein
MSDCRRVRTHFLSAFLSSRASAWSRCPRRSRRGSTGWPQPVTSCSRALALSLGSAALVACSLVIDADRSQCRSDADCVDFSTASEDSICIDQVCVVPADERWECLDAEAPAPEGPGPFAVKMSFRDLFAMKALSGVSVSVCSKLDVACSEPLSVVTSDASGSVSLSVSSGFGGYVSLDSVDIVPTRYFFSPPIRRNQEVSTLTLLSPTARNGILQQLDASPELGDVLVNVLDCQGVPVQGVTFSISPPVAEARRYYLVNGLPSRSAEATDATGYGGFANLAGGTWNISAVLADGRSLPTLSVVVKPGSVDWARFVPPNIGATSPP